MIIAASNSHARRCAEVRDKWQAKKHRKQSGRAKARWPQSEAIKAWRHSADGAAYELDLACGHTVKRGLHYRPKHRAVCQACKAGNLQYLVDIISASFATH